MSSHEGTHEGPPRGYGGVCVGSGWALGCPGWNTFGTSHEAGWGEVRSQRVDKVELAHTGCGGRVRGGVAGAEPPHKGGPNRPDRTKARRE